MTTTTKHLRDAIERYRRDIAVLCGAVDAGDLNADDVAVLLWTPRHGVREFVNDRRLRVKILEATVDLLREPRVRRRLAAVPPAVQDRAPTPL
jgi:hypothetical protein